jgi:transcriptional regulator with XRE-family HTH domain
MDVRQIVGENIRRYRREKGLSQAEVANRMGVDRAYISGLELGQRNPTIITLWHAAQALEVEVHLLLKADWFEATQISGRAHE